MRVRAFALLTLGAVLSVPDVVGQTTFKWPEPDTVTLARYTTFEECQALVSRLRNAAAVQQRAASGIAWDTMPHDWGKPRQANWPQPSLSPAATQTAQRCLARFPVDSIPLNEFLKYFVMYLHADMDTTILALVDRRMALADTSEVGAVFDSIIQLGRPIISLAEREIEAGNVLQWYGQRRWNALFEAILTRQARKVPSRVKRALLYTQLLHNWDAITIVPTAPFSGAWEWVDPEPPEDTEYALQTARRVVQYITDSITTDAERKQLEDSLQNRLGMEADERLESWLRDIVDLDRIKARWGGRDLDSLRKSTAAYVTGFRNLFPTPLKGVTPEGKDTTLRETMLEISSLIGFPAHPVAVDAWAWGGQGDSIGPRPTPGRVSLLVFFDGEGVGNCLTGGRAEPTSAPGLRRNCAEEMIALRRLAERFPALEIAVISPARGYFKYVKPITPAQEAELIRQLLASYGLRVPVGVMNLPPNWLPDPDGRRVDQSKSADTNWANYIKHTDPQVVRLLNGGQASEDRRKYIREFSIYRNSATLVDKDGIIVASSPMNREGASLLARYVEVLLNRP